MKVKTIGITLILMLGVISLAFGNTQLNESFNNRFKIVRSDDGVLEKIKSSTILTTFNFSYILKEIKKELQDEQKRMEQKSNYRNEVKELLFSDDFSFGTLDRRESRNKKDQNVKNTLDSLEALYDVDLDAIYANPNFKKVVKEFEAKLIDNFKILDIATVANAQNGAYFYRITVNYQFLTWGLNWSRKKFTSLPVLNVVSYILTSLEKAFREQRSFNQNMLLYYIENHPAETLGLTDKEADLTISSIYESKIPWYGLFESRRARASWDLYGVDKFFKSIRAVNSGFRSMGPLYDDVRDRINFAFQNVTYKGQDVIVNLYDRDHGYTKNLAIAYYYDSPFKIKRRRQIIQAARLGLKFLPVAKFIKNSVDGFLSSMYVLQRQREGALVGYFENHGDFVMAKHISRCTSNIFLR